MSTTLREQLHSTTRAQHTQINRTILARLPLALPPTASEPTAYYYGLLILKQIYTAFEQIASELSCDNSVSDCHKSIIRTIHDVRLLRSSRLSSDLALLRTRLKRQNDPQALCNYGVQYSNTIRESIRNKPYLLLAYTYTLYLALFNGGRYILRALESAGTHFWLEPNDAIECLSFWRFESDVQHAEDVKELFKHNFDIAEEMLTDCERQDVVHEGSRIFDMIQNMVGCLDAHMASEQETRSDELSSISDWTGIATRAWQNVWSRYTIRHIEVQQ